MRIVYARHFTPWLDMKLEIKKCINIHQPHEEACSHFSTADESIAGIIGQTSVRKTLLVCPMCILKFTRAIRMVSSMCRFY